MRTMNSHAGFLYTSQSIVSTAASQAAI